jgi:hypothetical protein
MNPILDDYYRQLAELSQIQMEKHYAWLRHLLLLASGTLSVLVALRASPPTAQTPHLFLSVALASLGLGILLGAVSLYGEYRIAIETVKKTGEELLRRLNNPGTADKSFAVKAPTACIISERACYAFLVVAVISLVIHAICN